MKYTICENHTTVHGLLIQTLDNFLPDIDDLTFPSTKQCLKSKPRPVSWKLERRDERAIEGRGWSIPQNQESWFVIPLIPSPVPVPQKCTRNWTCNCLGIWICPPLIEGGSEAKAWNEWMMRPSTRNRRWWMDGAPRTDISAGGTQLMRE